MSAGQSCGSRGAECAHFGQSVRVQKRERRISIIASFAETVYPNSRGWGGGVVGVGGGGGVSSVARESSSWQMAGPNAPVHPLQRVNDSTLS